MGAAAGHLNVELKARCPDPARVRRVLADAAADFRGVDEQRDVYFHVPEGRLKLRRGTIEQSLIFYRRDDRADVKPSHVVLARLGAAGDDALDALEAALTAALGVRVAVVKRREISFVGNVKFHVDDVPGLGAFVEIEAIGKAQDESALRAQCEDWRARLGIEAADLVAESYAEMTLAAAAPAP
jgi:predicted adenylyl cyclase CyaB